MLISGILVFASCWLTNTIIELSPINIRNVVFDPTARLAADVVPLSPLPDAELNSVTLSAQLEVKPAGLGRGVAPLTL